MLELDLTMFCITAASYGEELDLVLYVFQQLENAPDCWVFLPTFFESYQSWKIFFQQYIVCILQTVSDSYVYAQYIQEPTVSILYNAGVKIYSITISNVKNLGIQ